MKDWTGFALVVFLLLVLLAAASQLYGQKKEPIPHCRHITELDYYERIRVLPVEIVSYSYYTQVMEYKFAGSHQTFKGFFQVTDDTIIRGVNVLRRKKKVMVAYCSHPTHGTGANNRNKNLILVEAR